MIWAEFFLELHFLLLLWLLNRITIFNRPALSQDSAFYPNWFHVFRFMPFSISHCSPYPIFAGRAGLSCPELAHSRFKWSQLFRSAVFFVQHTHPYTPSLLSIFLFGKMHFSQQQQLSVNIKLQQYFQYLNMQGIYFMVSYTNHTCGYLKDLLTVTGSLLLLLT